VWTLREVLYAVFTEPVVFAGSSRKKSWTNGLYEQGRVEMLTIVEKVIFLQEIDLFGETSTKDLSHLAAIIEEIELQPGQVIFEEGDFPDAMYMVLEGMIRLTRDGREVMTAQSRDVFGTWALFDDEPRVVKASTVEESRLLRLDKEDFVDLLADNVRITQSMLKTLGTRLKGLMKRIEK
jgi:CRP-like cAMP-binding protein